MATPKAIVLDNGADSIRIGYNTCKTPRVFANAAVKPKREKRLYVADQMEEILDFTSLSFRRPFEKGYLVNLNLQESIWDRTFSRKILNTRSRNVPLLVTEPLFNLPTIQSAMDELLFEKYNFPSICRTTCPHLSVMGYQGSEELNRICALVVDSGFSFTHIAPVFDGTTCNYAVKRISVGGKLMTNYLKEIVSYREFNMMEETYLMEQVKKELCYISLDFQTELQSCRAAGRKKHMSPLFKRYALPNGTTHTKGFILEEKKYDPLSNDVEVLKLNNERITVPEILFHPSDIGINEAGIAEGIAQSISACPTDMHRTLFSNIIICGGNVLFTNFRERLETEVRKLAPTNFKVRIIADENTLETTWHGGVEFTSDLMFPEYCVSKEEYEEHGSVICRRRFNF